MRECTHERADIPMNDRLSKLILLVNQYGLRHSTISNIQVLTHRPMNLSLQPSIIQIPEKLSKPLL